MARYTAPEIIATMLCADINDVDRYQPSLFPTVGVYLVDGPHYYCCPRKGQKPPKGDRDGWDRDFDWRPAWTHERSGRTVFVSECK